MIDQSESRVFQSHGRINESDQSCIPVYMFSTYGIHNGVTLYLDQYVVMAIGSALVYVNCTFMILVSIRKVICLQDM